jgi:OmpR family response regulator RpaB
LKNNNKILVIDDDAYIRRVLELKLKKRGYQVTMAKDGEEGLQMIESQQPDVVISDIMMPKLDGKALCIKTNQIKQERPFLTIIVTARINPEDRDWVAEMQDTLFMEKPFSPNEIVVTIEKYLRDRG